MSQDYYIGLSRKQVEELLKGGGVGKRPYKDSTKFELTSSERYDGTVRIHIRMLPDDKIKQEPESAFGW